MKVAEHSGWNENPGHCLFKNEGYHIILESQNYCLNNETLGDLHLSASNTYTFEMQVAILRGQEAGMIFCRAHSAFYHPLKSPFPPTAILVSRQMGSMSSFMMTEMAIVS